MSFELKIGTLNLCLGLKYKKDLVNNILYENKIDVLCLQEVEIESAFDPMILSIPGYSLELEINSIKSRTAIYIKHGVKYQRKQELEGKNAHLVIVELSNGKKVINIYRSFNPVGLSAGESFKVQLELIKKAWSKNSFVMGDFNLDYNKLFDINYAHAARFEDMEMILLSSVSLLQIVNFTTWSRIVGNLVKSSTRVRSIRKP